MIHIDGLITVLQNFDNYLFVNINNSRIVILLNLWQILFNFYQIFVFAVFVQFRFNPNDDWCSESPPGGNLVDGLPPAPSLSSAQSYENVKIPNTQITVWDFPPKV